MRTSVEITLDDADGNEWTVRATVVADGPIREDSGGYSLEDLEASTDGKNWVDLTDTTLDPAEVDERLVAEAENAFAYGENSAGDIETKGGSTVTMVSVKPKYETVEVRDAWVDAGGSDETVEGDDITIMFDTPDEADEFISWLEGEDIPFKTWSEENPFGKNADGDLSTKSSTSDVLDRLSGKLDDLLGEMEPEGDDYRVLQDLGSAIDEYVAAPMSASFQEMSEALDAAIDRVGGQGDVGDLLDTLTDILTGIADSEGEFDEDGYEENEEDSADGLETKGGRSELYASDPEFRAYYDNFRDFFRAVSEAKDFCMELHSRTRKGKAGEIFEAAKAAGNAVYGYFKRLDSLSSGEETAYGSEWSEVESTVENLLTVIDEFEGELEVTIEEYTARDTMSEDPLYTQPFVEEVQWTLGEVEQAIRDAWATVEEFDFDAYESEAGEEASAGDLETKVDWDNNFWNLPEMSGLWQRLIDTCEADLDDGTLDMSKIKALSDAIDGTDKQAALDAIDSAEDDWANDEAFEVLGEMAELIEAAQTKSAGDLVTKSTEQDLNDAWSDVVDAAQVSGDEALAVIEKLNDLMQQEPIDVQAVSDEVANAYANAQEYEDMGALSSALKEFDFTISSYEIEGKSASPTPAWDRALETKYGDSVAYINPLPSRNCIPDSTVIDELRALSARVEVAMDTLVGNANDLMLQGSDYDGEISLVNELKRLMDALEFCAADLEFQFEKPENERYYSWPSAVQYPMSIAISAIGALTGHREYSGVVSALVRVRDSLQAFADEACATDAAVAAGA